jgi:hypothetical protein
MAYVVACTHTVRCCRYTVQELVDLYMAIPYLLYLALSLMAGVAAHQSYKKLLMRAGRGDSMSRKYGDVESVDGGGSPTTNFVSIPPLERGLLALLYSVASAVVGTQSVLMAKCTSQVCAVRPQRCYNSKRVQHWAVFTTSDRVPYPTAGRAAAVSGRRAVRQPLCASLPQSLLALESS